MTSIEEEEYATVVSILVVGITAYLVWWYARRGTGFAAMFFTFWGWFIVGSVCILLPLDLLPRQPGEGKYLETFWSINYWSSLILAFVVNPIVQSYYDAGDFTFRSKLWYSIKDNLIIYIVVLTLFGIFVIWALASGNTGGRNLQGFVICMANSFGLSLVAVSLGYSLVEIPRTFWYAGSRQVRLNLAQYRAAAIYAEDMQCREELFQVYRCLDNLNSRVVENDPLRPYFEILQKSMPLEDNDFLSAARNSAIFERDPAITRMLEEGVSLKNLASFHRYAKKTVNRSQLVLAQWNDCVDEAIRMEDLLVKERGRPPACDKPHKHVAYMLTVFVSPYFYRVCAVLLGIMSIVILWSECSLFDISLSPFKAMIDAVRDTNPAAVQIIALIPFSYISACCIFPLFRLRLGNFYNMRKKHRTDEISLLFNSINMLRLIAPLGYNFLALCDRQDAAFHKVVGVMDVIPIFGGGLQDAMPIFIPILCVCTFFNIYGKLLKCLNIQRFEYTTDFQDDQLAEGNMLLRKEKRKRGIREDSNSNINMVHIGQRSDDEEIA